MEVDELYELAEEVDRHQEAAERLDGENSTRARMSKNNAAIELAEKTISKYELDAGQVLESMDEENPEREYKEAPKALAGVGITQVYDSATEFVDECAEVIN
jgi:hypothetical protein